MKKFLSLAFLLIASVAFAGGKNVAVEQTAMPQPFSWEGFYLGLNVGGTFGTSYARDTRSYLPNDERARSWDYDADGFAAGLQTGYNWQRSNWLVGAELDLGYLGFSGDGAISEISAIRLASPVGEPTQGGARVRVTSSTDGDFYVSLRGKLGYAFGRTLIYVTGGPILVHYNTDIDSRITGNFFDAGANGRHGSDDSFRPGWTLGGGFEYAWNDRWSLKAEYLFYETEQKETTLRSPSPTFEGDEGAFQFDHYTVGHIARVGVNYHFGPTSTAMPMAAQTGLDKNDSGKNPMPMIAMQPFSWTGPYLGAHFGWGTGRLRWHDEPPEADEPVQHTWQNGIFGGVQGGLNYQWNMWVAGIEGKFSGSDIGRNTDADPRNHVGGTTASSEFSHGNTDTQIDWMANGVFRLGFAPQGFMNGRLLTYARAGLADAHMQYEGHKPLSTGVSKDFSGEASHFGPIVGGGFEWAFTDHWTARVEYNFQNFDKKIIHGHYSERFSGGGGEEQDEAYEAELNLHSVELGVNYKF